MTLREFVLSIGFLKSTLKQSDRATCVTLKLYQKTLPKPNKCLTSVYKFKKYLNDGDEQILKKHYYYSNCNFLKPNTDDDVNNGESVEIEEILDDSLSCECCAKENYFIEIPLKR